MSDSAREMKVGLNTKSGFRKFLHAREYHKVANGVYRHVKVAFRMRPSCHISYYFLHSMCRTEPMTDVSFSPNRVHHRKLVGRFRFVLTVFANLTLSMDQRISIEPPGLSTDAGLAAKMHSRRLLRRTNGWWMRGMRHVPELTHILIHYAKTTRYVSFFVTCGTASLRFLD
jgi:hypothetical protein